VDSGVHAEIDRLTIQNFRALPSSRDDGDLFDEANWGGGVGNHGTLTVRNCTFSGNWGIWGGGIFNDGNLTVEASEFSGNKGAWDQFGIGTGGGIFNRGTASVSNSLFSSNYTDTTGGGIYNGRLPQDGDVTTGEPLLTISKSTFSSNTAFIAGGAIAITSGSVTMDRCTVNGNTAYQYGGGMFVDPSVATIIGCTFSGNSAPSGADLYNLDSAVTLIASSIDNVTNSGGTITDPLATLEEQVAALDLTSGQKNSLISTLQAVQDSLTRDNTTAAVNQLHAFINQVNALLNSHRLGEILADSLIGEVDNLIGEIV
jgi:hypothetical protein